MYNIYSVFKVLFRILAHLGAEITTFEWVESILHHKDPLKAAYKCRVSKCKVWLHIQKLTKHSHLDVLFVAVLELSIKTHTNIFSQQTFEARFSRWSCIKNRYFVLSILSHHVEVDVLPLIPPGPCSVRVRSVTPAVLLFMQDFYFN